MARPPGPLDRGQRISTLELLSAVDRHGPHWTRQFEEYVLEAVSIAVQREINARNLYDGAHLTEQGRVNLALLAAGSDFRAGRLSIVRSPRCAAHVSCWHLACLDCDAVLGDHVTEGELERVALDAASRHRCG